MTRNGNSVEFCEECSTIWRLEPTVKRSSLFANHQKHSIGKDYPWICCKLECCLSYRSQGARKEHSKNCCRELHSNHCICEACQRLVQVQQSILRHEKITIDPFTHITFVSAKVSIVDRLTESLMSKELLSSFVPLKTTRDKHHLCRALAELHYNSEYRWHYIRVSCK